ncbi:MAG: hypothetical protein CVV64_15655 [Candidatus Wallbacteria bacterium HGW-Wallbacteria-1]|jgi:hypothetical protein|uniref:Heavy-metal chelation domain-containing protein n=1 Tax=Candidatus Wallbacteria bacterium HGW-Wallbacteria-1 TaxID=2013854 RepID=A0A2N1PLC7_9BACT|nr:MAG: hypothetical protein CVV64_15655 [Candidatus Wallbacteria bacterium HGW-Wallbacteria-1]
MVEKRGIADTLLAEIQRNSRSQALQAGEVTMGLYWTAVRTEKRIGLAFTYRSCFLVPHLCPIVRSAGMLSGRSAGELAELVRSTDTIEATIGLAAINSLLPESPEFRVGNAIPLIIDLCRGRDVAMVGYFPFAEKVREVASRFYITDKHKNAEEGDIAPEEIFNYFQKAEVRIITATTIINGSFDSIMEKCGGGGLNILFGPSVPATELMYEHNVHILVPVRVSDPELLMQSVREPAIVPQMQGMVTGMMTRDEELMKSLPPGNFVGYLLEQEERYQAAL